MARQNIAEMKLSKVYPLLVQKAERKNRTKEEVDQIINWLTGYSMEDIHGKCQDMTYEEFFANAQINPNACLIKGLVCGIRVEEIQDPLYQKIRYLDKLIDELAKGKKMEKILR